MIICYNNMQYLQLKRLNTLFLSFLNLHHFMSLQHNSKILQISELFPLRQLNPGEQMIDQASLVSLILKNIHLFRDQLRISQKSDVKNCVSNAQIRNTFPKSQRLFKQTSKDSDLDLQKVDNNLHLRYQNYQPQIGKILPFQRRNIWGKNVRKDGQTVRASINNWHKQNLQQTYIEKAQNPFKQYPHSTVKKYELNNNSRKAQVAKINQQFHNKPLQKTLNANFLDLTQVKSSVSSGKRRCKIFSLLTKQQPKQKRNYSSHQVQRQSRASRNYVFANLENDPLYTQKQQHQYQRQQVSIKTKNYQERNRHNPHNRQADSSLYCRQRKSIGLNQKVYVPSPQQLRMILKEVDKNTCYSKNQKYERRGSLEQSRKDNRKSNYTQNQYFSNCPVESITHKLGSSFVPSPPELFQPSRFIKYQQNVLRNPKINVNHPSL